MINTGYNAIKLFKIPYNLQQNYKFEKINTNLSFVSVLKRESATAQLTTPFPLLSGNATYSTLLLSFLAPFL